MSYSTIEMARLLEQLEESPEKIMFGKVLTELGNQSEERIRSAARQVPLKFLRDMVYQLMKSLKSAKVNVFRNWPKVLPATVFLLKN